MKNRQLTFDKSLEAAHMFREALQGWLFPSLEAELGALDDKHRAFVDLCAALREHFPAVRMVRQREAAGRPLVLLQGLSGQGVLEFQLNGREAQGGQTPVGCLSLGQYRNPNSQRGTLLPRPTATPSLTT